MQANFGVLCGDIEESYCNLGRAITKLSYDFVGIYYPLSGQTVAILFRSFDGTRITYFGNYLSVERLSKSKLIRKLETRNLDENLWRADGNSDSLKDRFCRTINRVMLIGETYQNYENLLLYMTGLSNTHPNNGFQIINDIILASTGVELSRRGEDGTSRVIIESRYFQSWQKHNITMDSNIHDDRLAIETRNFLTQFTQTFCDLLIKNGKFKERVGMIIENRNFMPKENLVSVLTPLHGDQIDREFNRVVGSEEFTIKDDENYLFKSSTTPSTTPIAKTLLNPTVTKLPDTSEEMNYIRDTIEDIMSGFNSDKVPVIQVPELVENFNKLAVKLQQSKINPSQYNPRHKSIGILGQSSSLGFYPDSVEVKLKCGQVVILPTKYDDFSDFTDDQLIQFHRFVKSCQLVDGRFNYMVEQIIRELAIRASS